MTNKKLNIIKPVTGMLAVCCCLLILLSACRKTEYNVIDSPAYLRVFNSLNYDINITNKDLPPPFLTMVIDPTYDASGLITGGGILGDFLDKRAPYAPPYPDKAGSTNYKNTEYPGSAKVLAGPILNGIDLSSWAQVKSGKHRIVFYSRPINPTPFFSLEARYRQTLLVDSTINITPGEIYTMEVLQKSVTQQTGVSVLPALYIRQEQFTKTPFSDSLLYVNFYNLSAEGYAAANPGAATLGYQEYFTITNKGRAYGDDMNIYYSLFTDDTEYPFARAGSSVGGTLISGYSNVRLGRLVRSQSASVAPYYSIPMFAGPDTTGRILSRQWELFTILGPQIAPFSGFNGLITVGSDGGFADANANFGAIGCGNISNDGRGVEDGLLKLPNLLPKLIASNWLPNLIKYTASGKYQQRSFATISTIEIINNQVYMMSVQRSYPAPNN
jgi:hypothetical protein